MSIRVFENLVDDNNIDIRREDIKFIGDVIIGSKRKSLLASSDGFQNSGRGFLFDIVANKRNSVDVDKFDYLARDAHNSGIKFTYDAARLMRFSRVIGGEICFMRKEAYNVYELFRTRYTMHKQVYSHRVTTAIELMIQDALVLANPYLNIFDCLNDPTSFAKMTDSVMLTIENSPLPSLQPSIAIIKRIRKRDLYKCVGEILIPSAIMSSQSHRINESEILACAGSDSGLSLGDIILKRVKINYGNSLYMFISHMC